MSGFNITSPRQRWVNPDGTPTQPFYRDLGLLFGAVSPAPVQVLTVTASPFVFQAPFSNGECFVIVQGGTVSKIEFSRDGINFFDTALTAGPVPLSGGDYLRVTYSGLPTMTFVP